MLLHAAASLARAKPGGIPPSFSHSVTCLPVDYIDAQIQRYSQKYPQRRRWSSLRRCLWPRHFFDYIIFSPLALLGFFKSSATLAAAHPCIPMLSYCALCLLECRDSDPECPVPTLELAYICLVLCNSAFDHYTFRSSCCVPSVDSWVDDRR